jgi:hypothetical protein
VRDLLTGESITLAAPDATLGQDLSGQAAHLRNLVRYEARSERSWLRIALGALLAVAAVGLILRSRIPRRRRRSGRGRAATTAVGGVLLACLAAPIRAQVPWIVQCLPAARVDNCGINATALVAAFFSREPILEHLAHDLGCSEWRHEPVALADLEVACRALGLETKTFQQATLRDAVAATGRRRGLAVIMVATDGQVAHCFVVAPGAQGPVIADPRGPVRECGWSDACVRRIGERFTGLGIVVWEGADRRERCIVDASPGVTTDLQCVRPIPGGVVCRYSVHWSGRPGWLQVAVADEVGAIATLMARLGGVLLEEEVR